MMRKQKSSKKCKYKRKESKYNRKLNNLNIIIELAGIIHVSIRAKTTGKVLNRTLKKWKSKANTYFFSKKRTKIHKCEWLPERVFKNATISSIFSDRMWWKCRKCGCITSGLYDYEVSEPMRIAYAKYLKTRKYD